MRLLRRILCRFFGHPWHLADAGPECMRCGFARPVAEEGHAQTAAALRYELRITSLHRTERLVQEESKRLAELLRRPAGHPQRISFRRSARETVELVVPGYPGLLRPDVAVGVGDVLGAFSQEIEPRQPPSSEDG
jgi:hypothetical protein